MQSYFIDILFTLFLLYDQNKQGSEQKVNSYSSKHSPLAQTNQPLYNIRKKENILLPLTVITELTQ